jgi:hypothetical protein
VGDHLLSIGNLTIAPKHVVSCVSTRLEEAEVSDTGINKVRGAWISVACPVLACAARG